MVRCIGRLPTSFKDANSSLVSGTSRREEDNKRRLIRAIKSIGYVNQSHLPEHFITRLTSIVPPKGMYMIVTQSIYKPSAKYKEPIGDHLIWVLVSSRAAYGNDDPKTLDGESISRLALQMTNNWHPVLRSLIAGSDQKSISAVPVLTSIPFKPWQSTNVTLPRDAIHTMTPLQGLGGSSALRDAGVLCRELVEVARGARTPIVAINGYEKVMISYGFAAVRRSAWFAHIVVSENRLLCGTFKAALRIATRIPANVQTSALICPAKRRETDPTAPRMSVHGGASRGS